MTVGWMTEVRFQAGTRVFLSVTISRLVLGHTQPPIQWVSTAHSPAGGTVTAYSFYMLPTHPHGTMHKPRGNVICTSLSFNVRNYLRIVFTHSLSICNSLDRRFWIQKFRLHGMHTEVVCFSYLTWC